MELKNFTAVVLVPVQMTFQAADEASAKMVALNMADQFIMEATCMAPGIIPAPGGEWPKKVASIEGPA